MKQHEFYSNKQFCSALGQIEKVENAFDWHKISKQILDKLSLGSENFRGMNFSLSTSLKIEDYKRRYMGPGGGLGIG